jgi:hypothetical protein
MIWRSGLVLVAVALSAFALPASAALYAEVDIAPPAASVEVVPDRTYTYTYSYEPGYVEHRSYTVETPHYYYYSEPRVVIEHFDDE